MIDLKMILTICRLVSNSVHVNIIFILTITFKIRDWKINM